MTHTGKIRRVDLDKQVFDIRNSTEGVTIKYSPIFIDFVKDNFLRDTVVTIVADENENLITFKY